MKRGVKKYMLKKAVQGLLPPAILSRSKMGFGVPIEKWFRHELYEFASDLLLSKRATERGYFRPTAVARLLHEHADGTRSWHYQLWNLVMLEMWHRRVLESPEPRAGADAITAVQVG
jgi:asparagine synthase (glutamine-hydrolysing)